MSKDDWPSHRVSDEMDHKLAYHAALSEKRLPECSPTYRSWRVIFEKDGSIDAHTYRTKKSARIDSLKLRQEGYSVRLQKCLNYNQYEDRDVD